MKSRPFLYRHVYGPVPSRRLGKSLGVDLVPLKRCTYDCIYCQLGRTTEKTDKPKAFETTEEICDELARKLAVGPRPDFISLAGSGEPTLNAGIGDLIVKIKKMTDIPVAVLTNGSLLWKDEVRSALMVADLILPSLDAGDEEMFRYVNRPHRGISFERMVAGLTDFVCLCPRKVWLEIFLLDGVTSMPSEIRKIDELLRIIRPQRVQLNTVTRPPAEKFAFAVSDDRMERLKNLFSVPAEVISRQMPAEAGDIQNCPSMADIVSLLARRPCTLDDVACGLGLRPVEALKRLDALCRKGAVTVVRTHDGIYYKAENMNPVSDRIHHL